MAEDGIARDGTEWMDWDEVRSWFGVAGVIVFAVFADREAEENGGSDGRSEVVEDRGWRVEESG